MNEFSLRAVFMVAVGIFATACVSEDGSQRTPRVPDPVSIENFSATPSSIVSGEETTLQWVSSNAIGCVAGGDLPGWTGSKADSGSETLAVNDVGTYTATLTCEDADGGSVAESITVRVVAPGVTIARFTAVPDTIAVGEVTTLQWDASHATACVAGGDLPGWSGAKEASGSEPLTINDSGTYSATLTCSDDQGGSDSATTTVEVSALLASITSFSATPGTVLAGESVTIDWASDNADSCTAGGTLPGWSGAKGTNGSEVLTQAAAGNYQATLLCENADSSDSAAATITVTEVALPVTIDAFTANPQTLIVGGSTTLAWASSSATSCTASGTLPGWTGDVAVTGSQAVTVNEDGVYTAELTCTDGTDEVTQTIDPITVTPLPRHRYSMANGCFALKSASTGSYVQIAGGNLSASGAGVTDAEPFYLKATALGDYVLYRGAVANGVTPADVVTAAAAPSNPMGATCAPGAALCQVPLLSATDSSVFEIKGVGDPLDYPPPPQFDVDTDPSVVADYRAFVDPHTKYPYFTFASKPDGRVLTTAADGSISLAAPADPLDTNQQFIFVEGLQNCPVFPEGNSNAVGKPYKGTTPDGHVVGYVDPHIHVTSTTFLGGAKWGAPFHKFGIPHAVGSCFDEHGENGSNDATYSVYRQDPSGHQTDGWPTFPSWPSRGAITHEAQYWKWMERAWLGGMRLLVNDLVDNGTLCELVRNQAGADDPDSVARDCNEMTSARKQASTTYAMQDYIDAQYGGRGAGFWQVVWDPPEARERIADGKLAVILGLELTNTFDCQMTYQSPVTRKEPYEEPTTLTPGENYYKCTEESIAEDMDRLLDLGLRQIISIHEFDIAFGGNGIFGGDVLNLGNRENSGGNSTPGVPPDNPWDPQSGTSPAEAPSGEFWTTYNCPSEDYLETLGDGWLWSGGGGDALNFASQTPAEYPDGEPVPPGCAVRTFDLEGNQSCIYSGQGQRAGGPVNCYPKAYRQCNARWMTPIGLYFYKLAMEKGLIIDFDHMAVGMKDQLLDLAGAQTPPYPIVSTHGTYGGITLEQARRVLRYGGHLNDGVGGSGDLIKSLVEVKPLWEAEAASLYRTDVFGYGFSTDTNGFSNQADPRVSGVITRDGPVAYPFTFFNDPVFDAIPEFATLDDDGNPATPYQGVVFTQPTEYDLLGEVARQWDPDIDGTAHGGMVTDMIQELRLQAITAAQNDSVPISDRVQYVRDLYNSAEMFLQTWERTMAARDGIETNGVQEPAQPILREAWGPNKPAPWAAFEPGDPK